MLHPDDLTPAALIDAVRAELAADACRPPRPHLDHLDGLRRCSATILAQIGLHPTAGAPAQKSKRRPQRVSAARSAS